jgi:alanine racemase
LYGYANGRFRKIAAKDGDKVIIFNGNPTLEEFSKYCKTIPTKF